MTERFRSLQRIGTDPSPAIRYGPERWALCPADKSNRAQEVYQHLPEPLNAKQSELYDEPLEFYQSGSSRRDPPPCSRLDRAWASEADDSGSDRTDPHGVSRRRRVALGARPLRRRSPRSRPGCSRCCQGWRSVAHLDMGGSRGTPSPRFPRRCPLGAAGFNAPQPGDGQRRAARPPASGVLCPARGPQGRSPIGASRLRHLLRAGRSRGPDLHGLRRDGSPPRLVVAHAGASRTLFPAGRPDPGSWVGLAARRVGGQRHGL